MILHTPFCPECGEPAEGIFKRLTGTAEFNGVPGPGIDVDYEGSTKVWWDDQHTAIERESEPSGPNNRPMVICANGHVWPTAIDGHQTHRASPQTEIMGREGNNRVAKAPPGWGEKAMRRLKEQYSGHPERAFATAWSLHGRGVSGEDYMSDKSSSSEGDREEFHPRHKERKEGAMLTNYARMLDEVVGAVCEPIIREAKRRQLKKKTRGRCVFPAESSSVTDDKDHFPINSLAQARNALARVMQYDACPGWYTGSLKGLQSAVRREVYGQFPGLKSRKEEREGK
jgi:hypothetical protein